MLNIIFNKKTQLKLFAIIFSMASFTSMAAYNAFPGKYKATLSNIESANIVTLNVDVWAGFPRPIRVTLPGVAVPIAHPKAPACQLKLVQKALNQTREFFKDAKYIEVRDINMKSTNDMDAVNDIYTNKGSLLSKLKSKGLTRPASVDELKPWC